MTDEQTPPEPRGGSSVPRWVVPAVLVALLVVVLIVALVLAGGDDEAAPSTTTSTTSTTTTTVPTTTTTTTTTSTTTTTTTTTTSTTTTTTTTEPPPTTSIVDGTPVFEPYEPLPGVEGFAALTGAPADDLLTAQPILAVKVDNVGRARPQWGLEQADVVFEENVEQITRFVALFHSRLPDRVGPVRSARTGDIDILSGLNRPILGWSGGNAGVTRWIGAAEDAGLLVDFTALSNRCYQRTSSKPAPHNLLLDPECARNERVADAGPARPIWPIEEGWSPADGSAATPSGEFDVAMDGNRVTWRWDEASGTYLRFQNGNRHVTQSGAQLAFTNVVVIYTPHPPSPVDARSPNPITVGRERAVVHRAGTSIEGFWERDSGISPFRFIDAATGEEIALAPGTTFVQLARLP